MKQMSGLESERRPKVVVLVGARRSGKTTRVLSLADSLKRSGKEIGGIAQPSVEGRGTVLSYNVTDLSTGKTRLLASRSNLPRPRHGYDLDPAALRWAFSLITRPCQVCLVDEIGWIEAEGGGHMPAVMEVIHRESARVMILSMRDEVLPKIRGQILPDIMIDHTRADFLQPVLDLCQSMKGG